MAFERIGVRAIIEGIGAFNRDAQVINRRLQEVTGNVKQTGEATQKAARDFDDLAGHLAIVGAGLTAVGAASGALLFSSVRLAARVETLGVVTARLGRNVGYTEAQIRDLEEAVRGQGITLQGSRQAIALMIQSNIDLSNATALAREAQDAAVIANINSTEAFQQLVYAITSGNVRIARTLGLQVSFQQAYEDTAQALGKTTLELTEQEKVAARTNAVLAAGVNIVGAYTAAMETAGKRVLSLDRFVEEANRIFGEQFVPVMGTVVDLLTAALKGFTELDAGVRNIIGSAVVLAATTGTVGGSLALLTAAFIKLKGAATLLAAGLGTSAAALGVVALAIGAVVAAAVLLANTIADVRAKQKALTGITYEHAQATVRATNTAEEYNREARRVNAVIDQQGILGRALAGGMAELSEQEFQAAKAALELQDRMTGAGEATDQHRDAVDELASRLGVTRQRFKELAESAGVALDSLEELPDLAEIEIQVRAELEKQTQERLQRELADLQFTIDTDISVQLGDTQAKLEELRSQLGDLISEGVTARAEIVVGGEEERKQLEQRISELYGDLKIAEARLDEVGADAGEATRLVAQQRVEAIKGEISDARTEIAELSEETQGQLDELQQQYTEKKEAIVGQIDEVTEAWRRQTKEIVFNLAAQRVQLAGLSGEDAQEALAALTQLAGPEGLGLVDENSLALLESFDKLIEVLQLPGDQAPIVANAMSQISESMADPIQNIRDLAEAFRDAALAAEELAKAPFPTPRFETDPFARNVGGRQFGGPVQSGRPYVVGERKPELFVPKQSGTIIPDLMSMIASAFPAIAPPRFAMAGAGSSTTNNFNQTINSSAPREPIIADFNLLALRAGRR